MKTITLTNVKLKANGKKNTISINPYWIMHMNWIEIEDLGSFHIKFNGEPPITYFFDTKKEALDAFHLLNKSISA